MKSMATCFVNAADYQRYWHGKSLREFLSTTSWNGEERRAGASDRRAKTHERRWKAEAGRRLRLADRRKS